jgi:hypothetical protein
LCTLSVGYLVFFELSPTTSLNDTNKVKSDWQIDDKKQYMYRYRQVSSWVAY